VYACTARARALTFAHCAQWLSVWLTFSSNPAMPPTYVTPTLDYNDYLYVYVGLKLGEAFFIGLVGLWMVKFSLNARCACVCVCARARVCVVTLASHSRNLHHGLLAVLMRAPMSFYDTTPIGRIINRFSFDLDLVDFRLPFLLQQYFVLIFQVRVHLRWVRVTVAVPRRHSVCW
jgi:ABC-type multidrug transport system fused ATPase/permease subunit